MRLPSKSELRNCVAVPPTFGAGVYLLSASFAGWEPRRQRIERRLHVSLDIGGLHLDHFVIVLGEPAPPLDARQRRGLGLALRHQIDRAFERERDEVGDMRSERYLALEAQTGEAPVIGHRPPQAALGLRRVAPQEPRQAALRELMEETGTDKAEIIAEMPDWITYDLPAYLVGIAFHGKFRGQKQKWFLMRFTGHDTDIDLSLHEPEFSDWKWFDLDDITSVIVPFKKPTYEAVVEGFRALVTKH